MATTETPCKAAPEDWFIERDGLQYHDDQPEGWDPVEKKQALIRRRKAKQACLDCPVRVQCLTLALEGQFTGWGIWGGYYPEEIRAIIDQRDRRRRGVD